MSLDNVQFLNNKIVNWGPALRLDTTFKSSITNTVFSGNSGENALLYFNDFAGNMYSGYSNTISNSVFRDNTAAWACIAAQNATVAIDNVQMYNSIGYGIDVYASKVQITGSTITGICCYGNQLFK